MGSRNICNGFLSRVWAIGNCCYRTKSVSLQKNLNNTIFERGTIIRKDGAYVTIFNEDANAHDQVHAGETYIPGDTQESVRRGPLCRKRVALA